MFGRRNKWSDRMYDLTTANIKAGMDKQAARKAAYDTVQVEKAARKEELAREKLAKAAKAMTCQICNRPIFAETGLIAHHGYQRPGDGWQTASCWGARELPYEVDRAKLGLYVESLLRSKLDWEETVIELAREEMPCTFQVFGRVKGHHSSQVIATLKITRADFDAHRAGEHTNYFRQRMLYDFDSLLAMNLREADRQRKFFADEHKAQKIRFDTWKQTHKWTGTTWEPVI